MSSAPVNVFVWFSLRDRDLGAELCEHLSPRGGASSSDGRSDSFGLEVHRSDEPEFFLDGPLVDLRVEQAEILVLVLSANFFTEFMDTRAMLRAFQRRRDLKALIVPVLARDVIIPDALSHLQRLPMDGRSVKKREHRDEAWVEVGNGIVKAAREWRRRNPLSLQVFPEQEASSRSDVEKLVVLFETLSALRQREEGMLAQVRELQELIYNEGRVAAGDVVARRFRLLARGGADDWLSCWRAWDQATRGPVTVHVLTRALAANEATRAAVLDRAARVADAHHPALAEVVQYGPTDGNHIIVTEQPDGRDLDDAVHSQALPAHSVLGLIFHLGQGLAALHRRNLVHGNVQPSSVRWSRDEGARLVGWDPLIGVRLKERFLPRPSAYLAPELRDRPDWRDEVTPQSDIYALAMLTIFALRGAELGPGAVSNPEGIVAGLPCEPDVRDVLRRGSAAIPAARYESVETFCRDLWDAHRRTRTFAEMIVIPGAVFRMGAPLGDPDARPHEKSEHEVRVDDFELARYPVTQALYEEVMARSPVTERRGGAFPVTRVSFLDAVEFCNRLSLFDGLTPAYSIVQGAVEWRPGADGYRLPTEAEWELAARGTDERQYPWGNEPPARQLIWNGAGSELGPGNRKGPAPVGEHPGGASPYGVEDMCGNVWEWCWDYFGAYPKPPALGEPPRSPVDNPTGPTVPTDPEAPWPQVAPPGGAYRVLRGGSWSIQEPRWLRTTARSMDDEVVRDPDIGFRIARGARRPPFGRGLS